MKYTKPSADLRVATLNICSIRNKLDELKDLMSSQRIDILGVQETWLDNEVTDHMVAVDGYTLHRLDRPWRRGGGVCIYYRDEVSCRVRKDLEIAGMEATWIEIGSKNKLFFGCVYRPPQEAVTFWEQLDDLLSNGDLRSHRIVLVGDFNVDVSPSQSFTGRHYSHLLELCAGHDLRFNIQSPTRISLRSPPTTLDLVLTSDSPAPIAEVVDVPFSDHSMVVTQLAVAECKIPRRFVESRNLKAINIDAFREDLRQTLWRPTQQMSLDDEWEKWTDTFISILDKHAPLRARIPKKTSSVPWMDAHQLRLIGTRNRLHRKFIRSNRDETAYAQFKAARAEAHAYNRSRKSMYFQSLCDVYAGNPKQLWNVINTVTCRKKTKVEPGCSVTSISQVLGDIVTDTSRPEHLPIPDEVPNIPHHFSSFVPVTVGQVEKLLSQLKDCKSPGSDGIPGSLLSRTADLISPSLTSLFNKSLKTGVFPKVMKIAHISPLFKGGDKSSPSNYRPISLLPILSKVLERIVHNQINTYLTQHALLPDNQFAYRKQFSAEDALTIAAERILQGKDKKNFSAACFIDLSKAFDKVQHKILIRDLHDTGIMGTPLRWFSSYLTGRVQRVVIGTDKSPLSQVTCGVPQGSVLGPTLFSLYVRNLRLCVPDNVTILQFADDIMVFCSSHSTAEVEQTLSLATTSLSSWLSSRGLILNEKKSQVLCFPATRGDDNQTTITVLCNGVALPNVSSAKYLGVTFDSHMTWRSHLQQKSLIVNRSIGALRRAKNSLSVKARFKFYTSVIISNLLYGSNSFIANLSSFCVDRFIKIQKKSLRAIFGLPNFFHTAGLFVLFKEENIVDKMLKKLAVFTWRAVNNACGHLVADLFSARTSYNTRGTASHSLVLPQARSLSGLHRPSFVGSAVWNALSAAARRSPTKANFKSLLPSHMPRF